MSYWSWIVSVMGDWWSYSCCFMGCFFQDLFSITCSIFVQSPQHSHVLVNDPEDRALVTGREIPNTLKMVFDDFLLNTQHYNVQTKGKWSNSRKGVESSFTSRVLKREPLSHPWLQSANLLNLHTHTHTHTHTHIYIYIYIYI